MSFAHYLLQVNLYLVVFYGVYKLLLDKETYFTLNRIYLVSAGVLSLCIPFIRLEWLTEHKAAQQVYTTVNWEAVLQQATVVTERNNGLIWANVFVYIYCAGILFFLGRLVFNLLAVKKMLVPGKAGVAFSFFGKKIIDQNLPQMDVIDIHEQAHIKQWHTVDILFFEILGIITWLNPIIYLYKKAIKNIHEFLADELAAAYQGDKAEYAMLLLSKSFGILPNALTNNFLDKSLIKKRIFMLHKERSKKIAIMKYGIFIPLFALLIVFSSATVRKNEKLISITDRIPLEKPIEIVQQMVTETPAETPVVRKVSVEGKADANWNGFYQFLSKNIKYPAIANSNEVQGNAQVKFSIKNGRIINISSNVELGSGCDEEVMKSILSYKDYKKIADGKYALTVGFNIPESSEQFKNKVLPKPAGYTNLNKIMVMAYLPTPAEPEVNLEPDQDKKVYDFVSIEKQPEFPGGIVKFYKYLSGAIKYPTLAQERNVQGKVFLSFVVEKNGSLSDVQITRGLGSGTDEEALRVIKESPKWYPGIQNGVPVRVKYNINVNFTLSDGETKPAKTVNSDATTVKFKNELNFNGVIVVDGVRLADNSSFNTLNPNNIESIEVLKDQAATLLYGSAAKAGAIVITTKSPKNSLFKKPDQKELTIDRAVPFFDVRQKF
ncbi:TonB family protein [Pedobacter sp. HDW13]|uniref:M56 family metallopeptidase n=1 Tax=Pedobacter sp. HDW13 TaxID=2714940 RepID=UPI00140738FC|nr:M56 family metallopeptidase [Pedobacter sp. HDW13]QIL39793.1 TonB family protein [Pedobacter sp. HDW13]